MRLPLRHRPRWLLTALLLAALLLLALGASGCATRTTSHPSVPVYTPAARGATPKAAPTAATITIIHIRPEARDYVQP